MIGAAIYEMLHNDANVHAIVGDRIFPSDAAQSETLPFITYQRFRPQPTKVKDGASPLDVYIVQINSVAESVTAAEIVAETIRSSLDFRSGIYANEVIQFVSYQGGTDSWQDQTALEGAQMIMDDYLIRHVR